MNGVIGSCSICGGEVCGHVGPWFGVIPPPPGRCRKCGAVESRGPTIKMVPMEPRALPDFKDADDLALYITTENTRRNQ